MYGVQQAHRSKSADRSFTGVLSFVVRLFLLERRAVCYDGSIHKSVNSRE